MEIYLKGLEGYQPRKNRVKTCSGKLLVYFNSNGDLEATSYGHWVFFKKINGVYVFNNYSYSTTTSHHQSVLKAILNKIGVKYVLTDGASEYMPGTIKEVLKGYYARYFNAEIKMARAIAKNKPRHLKDIEEELIDLKQAKKLLKLDLSYAESIEVFNQCLGDWLVEMSGHDNRRPEKIREEIKTELNDLAALNAEKLENEFDSLKPIF